MVWLVVMCVSACVCACCEFRCGYECLTRCFNNRRVKQDLAPSLRRGVYAFGSCWSVCCVGALINTVDTCTSNSPKHRTPHS